MSFDKCIQLWDNQHNHDIEHFCHSKKFSVLLYNQIPYPTPGARQPLICSLFR